MTLQDYLSLQNGTDVRGIASPLIASEAVTLTEEAVENIANAFCIWLTLQTGNSKLNVAIGYDSRISANALCAAAVKGITALGHNAIVTGLSTTPSMFMLLKDEKRNATRVYHGSIMITARHLPANRNGLKFFYEKGGLESANIKELLQIAYQGDFPKADTLGEKIDSPYLDEYAASLVKMVRDATGENTPLAN